MVKRSNITINIMLRYTWKYLLINYLFYGLLSRGGSALLEMSISQTAFLDANFYLSKILKRAIYYMTFSNSFGTSIYKSMMIFAPCRT